MRWTESRQTIDTIRETCLPLLGTPSDYDSPVDQIGDSRFVLIGEASHGTHEFYATRALITQRLIEEKGFNAVVIEADWPDAYRVNRYVRGFRDDADAAEALSGFKRFPQWMSTRSFTSTTPALSSRWSTRPSGAKPKSPRRTRADCE
jgi:hypothetical protein